MKIRSNPRFPLDPAGLVRELGVLWRELSTAINDLFQSMSISTVTGNTILTDDTHTVVATTSGLTITLPVISSSNYGESWTVILGVNGYTDTTTTDSFINTSETTIRLDIKGTSLTVRSTSQGWAIV